MAVAIVHEKPHRRKIPKGAKLRPKPAICITANGVEHLLTPGNIGDPQKRDQVIQALSTATVVVSKVIALLAWADRERVLAISMLARSKSTDYRLRYKKEESASNFFTAILNACPSGADVAAFQQWRAAAIEVAVICYPQGLEAPCTKLRQAMAEAGVKGVTVANLLKEANLVLKGLAKAGSPEPGGSGPEVKQVWSDAPCSVGLTLPANWTANAEGIQVAGRDGNGIVAPMLIADIRVNTNTREHYVNIAWKASGEWHAHLAPREMIADSRKIVGLAAYGFPVTSDNAGGIVRFLADFEACNSTKLAKAVVSSQLGWIEVAGRRAFLLGKTVLSAAPPTADGEEELVDVYFRGADDGNDQLADAFGAAGTLEGWTSNFLRLGEFPAVAFAMTASFAAPLLKIVNCSSISMDFAGETTTGKTTGMAYAASVWGNPNPDDPTSLVKTFNSTATCRERTLGVCRDLPAFFDDTQHARDDREVTQFAYLASQGRGRGRGTVTGIQRQETTRTVTFTNGEKGVTGFTEEGGVYARVLELRNPPFGERSPEVGELISELNDGFQHNYGHAGRTFVQFLLDHEPRWEEWQQRFAELKREFEQRAGENMFGRRLAPSLAAIRLAGELVHEALGFCGEVNDPVEPLFEELISEAGQADRPAAALKVAVEYAVAHIADFARNGHVDSEHPPRVCLGNLHTQSIHVEGQGSQKFRYIEFFPQVLDRILKEAGFTPNAMLRSFRKRGWLQLHGGDGGRNTIKRKVNGESTRLVSISRAAYADVCGDEEVKPVACEEDCEE